MTEGVSTRRPAAVEEKELPWGAQMRARLAAVLRMLRPPRRIRPTLAGWGFIGLSMAVGFAALNTGNNLLYLVLGMMLSLIAVSGILSELSVGRLRAGRVVPRETFVGRNTPVTLTLQNTKRRVMAVSVWLEEEAPKAVSAPPALFVTVSGGEQAERLGQYRFERRGLHSLGAMRIATTYPFGLFRRSYLAPLSDEIVVFPAVEQLQQGAGMWSSQRGELPHRVKGQGDDFFGLRAYVQGEDPRQIHWKTSARRGRLFVRENAAEQRRRVRLRLELLHGLPEDSVYEAAIVRLASLCSFCLSRGWQIALDIPGEALPYGGDEAHLRRILRALALAPRAEEAHEVPYQGYPWLKDQVISVRVGEQSFSVEGF